MCSLVQRVTDFTEPSNKLQMSGQPGKTNRHATTHSFFVGSKVRFGSDAFGKQTYRSPGFMSADTVEEAVVPHDGDELNTFVSALSLGDLVSLKTSRVDERRAPPQP